MHNRVTASSPRPGSGYIDSVKTRVRLAGTRSLPALSSKTAISLRDRPILLTGASSVELVKIVGPVDILINIAAHSIRRPLEESLDRWHDVERVMALNYFAPLRLIRGRAPGMVARGDGHIINVATWRVLPESSPMLAPYNASKAALSAVSRVLDTEWGNRGVHTTTLYYPARMRPIRIAPRKALALRALDVVAPRALNALLSRETKRTSRRG